MIPPSPSAGRRRCRAQLAVALFFSLLCVLLCRELPQRPAALAGERKGVKEPPRPEGIDGALVIVGGGKTPAAVTERFLQLAGGEKAHIVYIPTASERADTETAEMLLAPWKARKPASAALLHTRSRRTADDPDFCAPLKKATGVWIGGGKQSRLAEAYVGTAVEKELYALLKRGGVIGGTSSGAAVMSKLMIASGNPKAITAQGFDLLPGAVIDQHFLKRDRKERLLGVLKDHPGHVGLGIDENTALVVQGRTLEVVGDSTVMVCLPASAVRPVRTYELKARDVADLTALRRAALARCESPFPPRDAPAPHVPRGALVLVGGGSTPPEVTRKFIELAGGADAPIVILPTTAPDPVPPDAGRTLFVQAGARNLHVLAARQRKDAEDPKTQEMLRKARGVWLGGGRQGCFVDALADTRAVELMREVLKRGGVIGGTSAGATVQGDYLCRGSPLGGEEMMCEGYERGFGFLPGVAIDQHFSQRKRFGDMEALVSTYPQLLGIGIDEATALVVRGHVGEVMGKHQVYFYARPRPASEQQPAHIAVAAGGRYDLQARKALDR
jgi:cyanophycinase